jgi:hypothetical protein
MYRESNTHLHPHLPLRADSGFQGIQKLHACTTLPIKGTKRRPLTKKDKQHNHAHSSVRISVEHAIRRLKVFRILKEVYRNRRTRYGLRLNLIAGIVNMELVGMG